MRFGFWAVTALIFGALIAHFILQDKGLVTISMRGYVVTMSVPALAIVLIVSYFAVRLVLRVWRAPRELGEKLAERRTRRAGSRLTRGLIHLSEGDWARSERLLTQRIGAGAAPLANYLMAARAAQQRGAIERRNELLHQAFENLPNAEVAILVTQAQLQYENGENEAAVAALRRVLDKQPDNPVAAGLLARTYRRLGDTAGLLDLLPHLGQTDFDPQEQDALACDALEAARQRSDFDRSRLDSLWTSLAAKQRDRSALKAWRARALSALGDGDTAEAELRKAINRNWQDDLVVAYGQLRTDNVSRRLKQVESWLKHRPEDPVLLCAAARLCMAAELWGKARSYLEASIDLAADPGAYALYGQLLNQLGETSAASEAFRQGLSLASEVDLDVPMLDAPTPAGKAARS
ncbi:MAG: heme biosynthesis HemY N-terminal domain-containing protein [Gammaproteobacteria bacterium]|jgi:HemY protein